MGQLVETDIWRIENHKIAKLNLRCFKNHEVENRNVRFDLLPIRHASFSLTNWLTRLPSADLPASRARVAFMTFPISFRDVAPVCWIAASIALRISSSEAAAGRYCS